MGNYVNVDRLEFVVTYRCNSHCKHCLLGEDKRGREPASINTQLATRIVEEVTKEYSPTSIMTFGGEPLLFPEAVCAIHKSAKAGGIGRRDIITNAGHPREEREFRVLANRLAESGVTHAAVSVDGFHQEYIPVSVVEHNVQALLDAGIYVAWNPCWVISQKHVNPWNERTMSILNELSHLPVTESYGNNVQFEGNALHWLGDFMPPKTIDPKGICEDVPYANRLDNVTSVSVEPDGSILACKEVVIGNANEKDVVNLLRNYDPYKNPVTEAILHVGISELATFAQRRGVSPDSTGYYSICDMCVSLRRKIAKVS